MGKSVRSSRAMISMANGIFICGNLPNDGVYPVIKCCQSLLQRLHMPKYNIALLLLLLFKII
jgi:hypothetical protein